MGVHKKIINTYIISAIFGNIGYLGFPIISSIIEGTEGLISIHIAIYNLVLFTLGIIILEFSIHKKINLKILKDIFKNPLLIAVILSLFTLLININIPIFFLKTIDMLANGATPIILISLGIFFSYNFPRNINFKHVFILIFLKLLVLPSFFLIYFYMYGKTEILAISVLEAGMPIAITPYILASLYPMEKEIIALSILISSILSIFTLSLLTIITGII